MLLVVLLYHRRWRSLAGAFVTGSLFLFATLAVYGVRGTLAWIETMQGRLLCVPRRPPVDLPAADDRLARTRDEPAAGHRDRRPGQARDVSPLGFRPGGDPADLAQGVEPLGPRFASRMLGTMLVRCWWSSTTTSTSATLLTVPALVVMARGQGTKALRNLILAGLYWPTIVFGMTYPAEVIAYLLIGLMLATEAITSSSGPTIKIGSKFSGSDSRQATISLYRPMIVPSTIRISVSVSELRFITAPDHG